MKQPKIFAVFAPLAPLMMRAEILPLLVFATVPALLYRLASLPVHGESAAFQYGTMEYDLIAWWKAVFVFGCAIWMLVHLGLRRKAGIPLRHTILGLFLLAAAVASLLSTFLSHYPRTSWLGLAGQYEGECIILSYLVAVLYTAETAGDFLRRVTLVRCIGVVSCLNAVIGIGQGFGLDLWQSTVGRFLAGMGGMTFRYNFAASKMAYGASFQPNHFGMFVAMAGSVAVGMVFAERSRGWRVFWCLACVLCLIAVILSQSRAALGVMVLVGGGLGVVSLVKTIGGRGRRDGAEVGGSRCDLPPEIGPRGNRIKKTHMVTAVLVLVAVVLIGGLPQVRTSIASQWQRSMAEFRVEQKAYPLKTLELLDDRIYFGLENATISLGKSARMTWNATVTTDGISRACDVRVEEQSDGWTRIRVDLLPECDITVHDDGRVRLSAERATAHFITAGRKIFSVDFDDKLHARMTTPRFLPIRGRERLMSGRGYIWSRSLALVPDNPWFGTGPGTFALVFPNEAVLDMQRHFYTESENKAHALWLALLVHFGIVGFVISMALFAYIVYKGMTSDCLLSKAVLAGVIAYAIGAITNDSTVGVTPTFCLLCGLCVNARQESHDDVAGCRE